MKKKLAICIPSYNRAEYLLSLLKTICNQVNDENRNLLQICVSDNASEDDYTSVVTFMDKQNVEFIYDRADTNKGADVNFLRAVELSDAEYCWLAGDDDGIAEGAIDVVLAYIDRNPNISVFWGNRIICSKNLKPFMKDSWTSNKKSFIVNYENEDEIINYFGQLSSTTSLGYLTSLIVKRDEWEAVRPDCMQYIGTIYVQVAQFLSMLKGKGKMLCINECIALSRFGNDGFYKNLKQRIFLDYSGFAAIMNIFSDSPDVAESLKGIVRRHYNKIFLLAMACASELDENEKSTLQDMGYSYNELRIFECSNKGILFIRLAFNIIISAFTNFKWFIKTVFIALQKV